MRGFEVLLESLNEYIDHLDEKSTEHKLLHRRFQSGVIALTALTTIVAGAGLILPVSSGRPRRVWPITDFPFTN